MKHQSASSYVRKSLTSSTVISPVESRVRSAQLRGESSGVSRTGEDRLLGGSSVWPVREEPRDPHDLLCCSDVETRPIKNTLKLLHQNFNYTDRV